MARWWFPSRTPPTATSGWGPWEAVSTISIRAPGDAVNLDAILHKDNVLGDRRIMSLHRDRQGSLWIGTWGKGLERLSEDGQITIIGAHLGDPHGLSAPGIAAIYEAKNGLLWIGTHGGGANILDPDTGIVRQLPVGADIRGATSSENITSFLEDAAGNVWMGTENGGLDVADPRRRLSFL
jgi:ligand-binding sensor domain-containing protein